MIKIELIEITSIFYLKFKENNENDMTFCYFSCLGRYCFRPTPMAALTAQAAADVRLTGLMRSMADMKSCQIHSYFLSTYFENWSTINKVNS